MDALRESLTRWLSTFLVSATTTLPWIQSEWFLRGFAIVAGAISAALLLWAIRTMRRPCPIRWHTPMLGLAMSLVGTAAYLALVNPRVAWLWAGLLLILGCGLGYLQGRQTRLFWKEEGVWGERSMVYMWLWGAAYLATQGLGQLQNALLYAVGVLTLFFTLGIAIGSNLNIAVRRGRLAREGEPA